MDIQEIVKLLIWILTPMVFGVWGLLKFIFRRYDKEYQDFKKTQLEENLKNYNHRHKYDGFDKIVNQLVDDAKEALSDKIDASMQSINKSVDGMNTNINLILTHILGKK